MPHPRLKSQLLDLGGQIAKISILLPYVLEDFLCGQVLHVYALNYLKYPTARIINLKEVTISLCLTELSCFLVACPIQSICERQDDVQVLQLSGSIKGQGYKIDWDI